MGTPKENARRRVEAAVARFLREGGQVTRVAPHEAHTDGERKEQRKLSFRQSVTDGPRADGLVPRRQPGHH